MIISDLNYLEVVAEASSVVGGTTQKNHKQPKVVVKFELPEIVKKLQQQNVADVKQNANAESAAVSNKGDAKSEATAVNNLDLNQANVGSL